MNYGQILSVNKLTPGRKVCQEEMSGYLKFIPGLFEIEQIGTNSSFSVFPNPASYELRFNLKTMK